MNISVQEDGTILLEEVYNGITLKTNSGEIMHICMRDSGFEFKYQDILFYAREGNIEEVKLS